MRASLGDIGVLLLYLGLVCWKVSPTHSQVDGDIRLAGYGASRLRGKLEIFYNGAWGTICAEDLNLLPGSQFDLSAANVVCRQLGVGYAVVFYSITHLSELRFRYGRGSGPIHLDKVDCDGTEPHLLRCKHGPLGHVTDTCTHTMDISVECSDVYTPYSGEVKLSGRSSGVVELYSVGQWGAVCYQSGFGLLQANAVCQQLGYTEASSYSELSVGDYSGVFWSVGGDAISCNSTPCYTACLEQLPEAPVSDCSLFHVQCAFVVDNALTYPSGNSDLCTLPSPSVREGDVRLSLSTNDQSKGRVEIFYRGTWGTVCDQFGYSEADVVCKQLGFPSAINIPRYPEAVETEAANHSHSLSCVGFETQVSDCSITNSTGRCIQPLLNEGVQCTSYNTPYSELSLRGGAGSAGNLLIYIGTFFQPICDVGFGMNEAHVACRQLGYDRAIAVRSSSFFGNSSNVDTTIVDDGLFKLNRQCLGTESHLLECNLPLTVDGQCRGVLDEVGIQCSTGEDNTPFIRLVGGDISTSSGLPISGRLEVNFGGAWGTVANENGHFDHLAAHVTCTSLGYPTAKTVYNNLMYGEGSGPVVLTGVNCSGYEDSVFDCQYSVGLEVNYTHSYDVGLECSEELSAAVGSLRLVSPDNNKTSGRLEIFINGVWMSVCGRNFSQEAATVACRQLGLSRALNYCTDACFGPGSGYIYYAEDGCAGTEDRLAGCDREIHNSIDCDHSMDVGIVCESIILQPTTTTHQEPISTTDTVASLVPGLLNNDLYIIVGVCSGVLLVLILVLIICCTCCVAKRLRRNKQGTWRSSAHCQANGNTNGSSANGHINNHIQQQTYIQNNHTNLNTDLSSDTGRWVHGSSITGPSKLAMEKVSDFDDPRDAIEMNGFMNPATSSRASMYKHTSHLQPKPCSSPDCTKGNLSSPSDYDLESFSHLSSSSRTSIPEVGVSVSTLYVEDESPASPPPGYDELEFLPSQPEHQSQNRS